MSFKAGDKVKIKEACSGTVAGEICTLREAESMAGERNLWAKGKDSLGKGCKHPEYWKKVGKEKPVRFVVFYDEIDRDPAEKFTSRKELVAWIKEAKENKDIIFDSIEVYPVGERLEVEIKTNVSLKRKSRG